MLVVGPVIQDAVRPERWEEHDYGRIPLFDQSRCHTMHGLLTYNRSIGYRRRAPNCSGIETWISGPSSAVNRIRIVYASPLPVQALICGERHVNHLRSERPDVKCRKTAQLSTGCNGSETIKHPDAHRRNAQ